jgi:glucokinase
MVAAIAQLDPEGRSLAIGVGTPGPADAAGRVAKVAINLGWKNVPLADWLEEHTGKPTVLANDANCAGLGEIWLGAGRSFRDAIMLTLGTGVGGAVIMDGKLFVGRDGTAGELGLITLDYEGHTCNSGNRGSLEQHLSVQAIRRRTGLEPEELGRRARAGDADAIAFWETYGCELGAGLASLIYVLTPEAILIGGGVSASAEFFFPSAQAEIERRVLPSSRAGLQLLPAALGNQAGIVGAAKLAWQQLDEDVASHSLPAADPVLVDLQTRLLQTQLAYWSAREMSQFKAGFLARTSHELRSPLNSVISLHQLILSGLCEDHDEELEFIAQADAAAQKMLKLLDRLIHVSKIEQGTAHLQLQPLQLAAVLGEIRHLTSLQAQNRSLRLDIDLPDEQVYVLADPLSLQQILLSLVNAPLLVMQEGTVHITTHTDSTLMQAAIVIEDERPATAWSEPLDQINSPETAPSKLTDELGAIAATHTIPFSGQPSPSLALLVNQTLLEYMNGRLEVLATPTSTSTITRIQCTLPLVAVEDD